MATAAATYASEEETAAEDEDEAGYGTGEGNHVDSTLAISAVNTYR